MQSLPVTKESRPVGFHHRFTQWTKRAVVPQPVAGDDPEVTIISQIMDLNGIVAIAVFNDNRTVIMMGDADSEVLVTIARKMLETAKKMTPLRTWGPFTYHDPDTCGQHDHSALPGQLPLPAHDKDHQHRAYP